METDRSTSSEPRTREFYLPATARLSTVPGRIERFLAGLAPQRADESTSTTEQRRVLDFYLPGTLQLSAEPGRVERVVAEVRRRGGAGLSAVRSKIPTRSKDR